VNPSIINIDTGENDGNVPNFWGRLNQVMRDKYIKTKQNACRREEAFQLFREIKSSLNQIKESRNDGQYDNKDEIDYISDLLKAYDHYQKSKIHKNSVLSPNSDRVDDDVLPTYDEVGAYALPPSSSSPEILEVIEKFSRLPTAERKVAKHINATSIAGDHSFSVDGDELASEEFSIDDNDKKEFTIAIEHSRSSNEIFLFDDYADMLFTNPAAFVNSSRVFLVRDCNEWNQFSAVDPLTTPLLPNGVVPEAAFDRLLDEISKSKKNKQFVDMDIFKEFMIEVGVMSRCELRYNSALEKKVLVQTPSRRKKGIKTKTSRPSKRIYNEGGSGSPKRMLIIPSITNNSIDDYDGLPRGSTKSLSHHSEDFFLHGDGYELWYTWANHCISTISLMNVFLVQLYTHHNWNLELLRTAKIHKEKLENRKSGVVSIIDFDRSFIIVEEEAIVDNAFYTCRNIRIFLKKDVFKKFNIIQSIDDVEKMITKCMHAAEQKISKMLRIDDGDMRFHHGIKQRITLRQEDLSLMRNETGKFELLEKKSNCQLDVPNLNEDNNQITLSGFGVNAIEKLEKDVMKTISDLKLESANRIQSFDDDWIEFTNIVISAVFESHETSFDQIIASRLGKNVFDEYKTWLLEYPGIKLGKRLQTRHLLDEWRERQSASSIEEIVQLFICRLENEQSANFLLSTLRESFISTNV